MPERLPDCRIMPYKRLIEFKYNIIKSLVIYVYTVSTKYAVVLCLSKNVVERLCLKMLSNKVCLKMLSNSASINFDRKFCRIVSNNVECCRIL